MKAKKRFRFGRSGKTADEDTDEAKHDWETLSDFLERKTKSIFDYIKIVILYLFLPALALSAFLFYVCQNPKMHRGTAYSWFFIFIFIRQIVTFSFAKLTEVIVVDILALKTRILLRFLGPLMTLLIVQSKGWPFLMTWWAIYDIFMLSGVHEFADHWLFYQHAIGLFNAENPSGGIPADVWNYRILIAGMVVGILSGLKRFVVGIYLGVRQYTNYGTKLADVIQRMIVVSQVAELARGFERHEKSGESERPPPRVNSKESLMMSKWSRSFRERTTTSSDVGDDEEEEDLLLSEQIKRKMLLVDDDNEEDTDDNVENRTAASSKKSKGASIFSFGHRNNQTGSLTGSERNRISQYLENWEEPQDEGRRKKASIKAILQFRQTLAFMDVSFPFTAAFGPAHSREDCVQSAQEVFNCLLLGNHDDEGEVLHFDTLAPLVMDADANAVDETKLKDLVRVFRPDKDGDLDVISFVRSVDRVYKDLRLLKASIQNSSQIDEAFELIINCGFFFMLACILLASWGIDPLAIILSLSSVVVAFSFAIGAASSKYCEGVMFILLRSPYDIGDRISVNTADERPEADGVFTWFVEEVTLYYTTLRLGATNEVATIANSSLANCRIINAASSPKALVYVNLKFGIDVPYSKVQLFKETVNSFVKSRPREWLSCSGIRATRVEADLGYIQYVIILQHRERWQNIGEILESKAAVMSYCLEVQKQLGMRYLAPPTPIDLEVKNGGNLFGSGPGASPTRSSAGGTTTSPVPTQAPGHNRTQSEQLRRIAEMFAVPR